MTSTWVLDPREMTKAPAVAKRSIRTVTLRLVMPPPTSSARSKSREGAATLPGGPEPGHNDSYGDWRSQMVQPQEGLRFHPARCGAARCLRSYIRRTWVGPRHARGWAARRVRADAARGRAARRAWVAARRVGCAYRWSKALRTGIDRADEQNRFCQPSLLPPVPRSCWIGGSDVEWG